MSRRITIMLESDLEKKLRALQAKLIKNSTNAVSFSQVLNQAVAEGLKCSKSKF